MTLHHALISNTGPAREINEDTARVIELQLSDGTSRQALFLAVIADGMGGHAAGEVASQTAVDSLINTLISQLGGLAHASEADVTEAIAVGFDSANATVYQLGQQDDEKQGMGTTLTALLFVDKCVCIGHIGDSRVYRIRDGSIKRLTRDHTLVQEKVDAGLLTEEEVANSEERNVLRRAVGTQPHIQPDLSVETVDDDDRFLLCTDGVYNSFTDGELLDAINHDSDLENTSAALINEAMARDGSDNLSLIYITAPTAGPPRRRRTHFREHSITRQVNHGIQRRALLGVLLALVIATMICVTGSILRQIQGTPSPIHIGMQTSKPQMAPPKAGDMLVNLTLSLESDVIEVWSHGNLPYTVIIAGEKLAIEPDDHKRCTILPRFLPAPVQRVSFLLSAVSTSSVRWKLTRMPATFPAKSGVWIDRHLAKVNRVKTLPLTAQHAREGKVSIGESRQPVRQIRFYLDAKVPIPIEIELAPVTDTTNQSTGQVRETHPDSQPDK